MPRAPPQTSPSTGVDGDVGTGSRALPRRQSSPTKALSTTSRFSRQAVSRVTLHYPRLRVNSPALATPSHPHHPVNSAPRSAHAIHPDMAVISRCVTAGPSPASSPTQIPRPDLEVLDPGDFPNREPTCEPGAGARRIKPRAKSRGGFCLAYRRTSADMAHCRSDATALVIVVAQARPRVRSTPKSTDRAGEWRSY